MRLLQFEASSSTFSLVEFTGNDTIPPYAILSHTWGGKNDEVTYKDMIDGTGIEKSGYRKLGFCGKQAAKDGLDHFWIDTCCIDKSSSAELSEAINSMFSWYQKAEKCYVYLSDVSDSISGSDEEPSRSWKPDFRRSRWFTRGWTLQELIAPAVVQFFSKEGTFLGDKWSLEQTIHEITRVTVKALRGFVLSRFTIEERMAWAESRKTTCEEDKAYSLLGIFDIHMPLIYGEGEEKALKRLQKEITESSAKTVARDARLSKIHRWLSAPDPSVNYQKALKQRQHDTGLWFLEGERYASWKEDAASYLWLHGIPGCGKTILSSTILEDLLQPSDSRPTYVVVYFYFDFNDVQKQNAELMLRSLVDQLSQQAVDVSASLEALYSSYAEKGHPSLGTFLQVAHQMIQQLPQVYIMLDALDECTQRAELMEILETIAGWKLKNVHLIMTSRRERDIESTLQVFIDPQNSICLQSEVVDRDIQQYVRQRLSDDKGLHKWNDAALRKEIEAALMKGSKGMFRWAVCQLDTLGKCRNRAMLRKALASLPPTLDKTYDRILSAITDEDTEYAVRILLWMAFSERPLSIHEIAEVVAIDVARTPVLTREEVLEDPQDILDICSSLVTIITDDDITNVESPRQVVVLAHYSVKEYLVSERIQRGEAARYSMQATESHKIIAKACLGYLSQFQARKLADNTIQEYKLALYSAQFWVSHTRKAGDRSAEIIQAALGLLSIENAAYLNWIRIHDPDKPWHKSKFVRTRQETSAPLYYAALLGLEEVVRLLLHTTADVNAQSRVSGSALQAASKGGHQAVVKLLLASGTDVNAQGGAYGSALLAASTVGHEAVVKLLLASNADINAQGGIFNVTALQAASDRGHEAVVKLLLASGADVNARSEGNYPTALHAASKKGHEAVVKLLLASGADVNAQGGAYGSVLLAASTVGHEAVVKLLLASDVDVNAQGGTWNVTALQAASENGHEAVVKLLLASGADVNAQGGAFSSALKVASENGHEAVVKLLLASGADVNAWSEGNYPTALHAASQKGHEAAVKLLLDEGAAVTTPDQFGRTALLRAAENGHDAIVFLLMSGRNYLGDRSQDAQNLLSQVIAKELVAVVESLITKDKDELNSRTLEDDYNPLLWAAKHGHEIVVKILLQKAGVGPNLYDAYRKSALSWAAEGGHKAVVQLLLAVDGVDLNGSDELGDRQTPLAKAAKNGHDAIVKMLLAKHGIDVNCIDEDGKTPQALAAQAGHDAVVQLLRSHSRSHPKYPLSYYKLIAKHRRRKLGS